jgi:hypothetical protein
LKWVEEKQFLKQLFDPRAELSKVDLELGLWFVEGFQCEYVGESLSVLRRQGQRLNHFLWTMIAQRLLRREAGRPTSEAMHRWLIILLNDVPSGANTNMLENLTHNLVFPEDTVPALMLFEYLSCPVFDLKNDFWSELQETDPRPDVKFQLVTRGGGFWLNDFWTSFLNPNLAAVVDKLELIVTCHLQKACFVLKVDGRTGATWDALSLSRTRIDRPDNGRTQEGLGVLVDAAFAVIQWNVQYRPSRSEALIDLWFTADSLLLKRLAIIGVALNTHWTANRKLEFLVRNDLFYRPSLMSEVLEVLHGAYPHASSEPRKAVIERVVQGPDNVPGGTETAAAYQTYSLVYGLHQSDPECHFAKEALHALQVAHPDFSVPEQQRPDASSSGPECVVEKARSTVEDLILKEPKDEIDFLQSFVEETPFGQRREGFLRTVSDAAIRNYQWSRKLALELEARGAWDVDLWSPILRGWTVAALTDQEWDEVLNFLYTKKKLHGPYVNEIASLLKEGIKKTIRPLPDSSLPTAVELSKELWSVLVAQGGGVPEKIKDPEWLALAINHPAGDITLFWLSWLVRVRNEAGSNWKNIPGAIRGVLDPVLIEPSYAGELGRVLLASQLAFLSNADESWTLDHVLPLFDWPPDGKRAIQAFHGFLTWGRQTENLVPHLVPVYEKAFNHIREFGRLRERFVEYVAGVTFASSINPITHGWLNRFLAVAAQEDRAQWAWYVRQILRTTTDEARAHAWRSWMKSYWEKRLLGVPVPLNAKELGEMVEWALNLGPNFSEAVDSVWGSPKFELRHSALFTELAGSMLPLKYPVASAKLLLKVLQSTNDYQFNLEKVEETVRRIAPLGKPTDILSKICNELARLGYPPAADLQAWLDSGKFVSAT